jgi:hypothetical protein
MMTFCLVPVEAYVITDATAEVDIYLSGNGNGNGNVLRIIRVANSPVFPGMSRISTHMSRVPAMAAPGRIMSRFSAGL